MEQYLLFAVLGLATGAVYAALALSVVLGHRGSGFVNFGTGAIAGYVAYVYAFMRQGQLQIPPFPKIDLGAPQSFAVSFIVAITVAVLLALVMQILVFRPLQNAPQLAKIVATVGITLVLEALVVMRFGPNPVGVNSILPTNTVKMFGANVSIDRIILAGLAVVLAVGMWAAFRFTRLGLSLRATSENPKGATLLGISPAFQSTVCWVAASVAAGAVGVLAAPLTSLTPQNFPLFIIPAVSAALVGGFESFGLAVGAGLIIAMAQQVIGLAITQSWWTSHGWLPQQGVADMLPVIVIIAALQIRGRRVPSRGLLSERLPAVPYPKRVLPTTAVLFVVVGLGVVFLGFQWRNAIMVSLIGVLVSLSLVVLVGFVGQISLAQLAIAGFGAFLLAHIATNWGLPFPISTIVAIVIATIAGTLISVPALRIRGVQLAGVTLAIAYGLDQLVFNDPGLVAATSGPPRLFGFSFGPLNEFPVGGDKVPTGGFGLYLLVLVTLTALAVVNLRRSPTGRRMIAVRSNERSAASVGIDVARTKLVAFTVSSAIAATAGTCLLYLNGGQVNEAPFDVFVSLSALAIAYLGGITSVSGAMVAGTMVSGGLTFYVIDTIWKIDSFQLLIAGLGVVITAVLNPEGIAGGFRVTVDQLRRARSRRLSRSDEAPLGPKSQEYRESEATNVTA